MNEVYIVAAYGRQYYTNEEMLNDWNNGKDFLIYGGPYLSIRDLSGLKEEGIKTIIFVHNNGNFNMHL
jgi:hypothetical protein